MSFKIEKFPTSISRHTFISIIGALYLFLSTQPFFMWDIPGSSLIFFGLAGILAYMVYTDKGLWIKRNHFVILSVFVMYATYLSLPLYGGMPLVGKLFLFAPLFFLLFLSPESLLGVFKVWKIILIFFSIYALIVYILFFFQVDMPYGEIWDSEYIPPPSRAKGHYYQVYGLVVSSTQTHWRIGGILTQRLIGPFPEPGHFSIYIGFTMLIDRLLGNKTSIVLFISGLLTLSPAFVLIYGVIEAYRIIIEKKINKQLYFAIFAVFAIIMVLKGAEVKDRVMYILFERHTDLDKRAPEIVRNKFMEIVASPQVIIGIGSNNFKTFGGKLSDPRGMVAKFGIIGLVLSLGLIFLILSTMQKVPAIFLFGAVAIVYLHRVWMFESPYIFTFMVIAAAALKATKNEKFERLYEIRKEKFKNENFI